MDTMAALKILRDRHHPERKIMIYDSKDGVKAKVFDALQWLAAMGFSLPFPSTQTRSTQWICMGADGAVDRMGKMREEVGAWPFFLDPQSRFSYNDLT